MFAKIRLQLHSTVHVSGVEKYLPLRSADFFRFADSFRFASLGPSVASLCAHKKLKPTRRHNNDPSHLHLKQHAEVPQCHVEHAVKSENGCRSTLERKR